MSKFSSIKPIIIGARKSKLSQIQAHKVAQAIGVDAVHIGYITKGDKIRDKYLQELGGKELFVKEIEQALLNREIDIAVHSFKDMPAQQPNGTVITAILSREDPRDALISINKIKKIKDLPKNAKIGTASPRRAAQIKFLRSDLNPVLLRGNVDTRLKKIINKEMDAAIIAMSGILRLSSAGEKYTELASPIDMDVILPAAAQGAICVECRADDHRIIALCSKIHNLQTAKAVLAERSFTSSFGASCHTPVAAFANQQNGEIILKTQLLALDGSKSFTDQRSGKDPLKLGRESALYIAQQAGEKLLKEIGAKVPADYFLDQDFVANNFFDLLKPL